DAASGRVAVQPPAWLPAVDQITADRRWMDVARYYAQGGMANVQTKRGCHYKCSYCAYPIIEGRGMRTPPPEGIADEVPTLLDEPGAEQFCVVDGVFTAPRGGAEAVCTAPRPSGRPIKWSCFVAPGNSSAGLLALMLEAGCQSLDFGPDAAAPA